MSDDYLWDKTGEPDPEIASLEQALSSLRHEGEWQDPAAATSAASPPASSREPAKVVPIAAARRPARRPLWLAAGGLALAASIALWLALAGSTPPDPPAARTDPTASSPEPLPASNAAPSTAVPSPPAPAQLACSADADGFPFEAAAPVQCAGSPARAGKLPPDTWLETPESTTATLRVADIGAITLHPGSRLRIVRTGPTEHRMELVRGSLHAKVKAPPRLFVIDTRAAAAVDLGCEYDLRIDDQGRTDLHVLTGAVSLEGKGRSAFAPQRTRVVADPERGPGLVLADTASFALQSAAARFESGALGALDALLRAATRTDSVTLWNLLPTGSKGVREKVIARIDQLALRARTIPRDRLLAGDPDTLEAFRTDLEDLWFVAPPPNTAPPPDEKPTDATPTDPTPKDRKRDAAPTDEKPTDRAPTDSRRDVAPTDSRRDVAPTDKKPTDGKPSLRRRSTDRDATW
ncbi:MAG: FecR domain-containing protein [Polyangiaceae bacterium]